ncbi:unnamed protein product [Clavelina lepadiformis]|uniref:glutaminyl-peptide cyclotransferase n=1 Tax=Clavelina lepadiformis TaxID=159417 RepID=A0ABP0FPS1_CLALP
MLSIMSRYRKGRCLLAQEGSNKVEPSPTQKRFSISIYLATGLIATALMFIFFFNKSETTALFVDDIDIRTKRDSNEFSKKVDDDWYSKRSLHSVRRTLNSAKSKSLLKKINIEHLKEEYLWPILRVRTPGSDAIVQVALHIVYSLRKLGGWSLEFDIFEDKPPAPYPMTRFINIIANTNPHAARKLVLACHYDSKIFPRGEFVGATDSAVPCSMMLEMANVLNELLLQHTQRQKSGDANTLDVGLELIFFDGEEAFKHWTETDSLYGSRHLASLWKNETWHGRTRLDSIDLLVLLDLIGHSTAGFANFLSTQSRWFAHCRSIEQRLRDAGWIGTTNDASGRPMEIFPERHRYQNSAVEDDHIPFLRQGVPIMHLISVPFPNVWHKLSDDARAVDDERTLVITRILTIFVAEYLGL